MRPADQVRALRLRGLLALQLSPADRQKLRARAEAEGTTIEEAAAAIVVFELNADSSLAGNADHRLEDTRGERRERTSRERAENAPKPLRRWSGENSGTQRPAPAVQRSENPVERLKRLIAEAAKPSALTECVYCHNSGQISLIAELDGGRQRVQCWCEEKRCWNRVSA